MHDNEYVAHTLIQERLRDAERGGASPSPFATRAGRTRSGPATGGGDSSWHGGVT